MRVEGGRSGAGREMTGRVDDWVRPCHAGSK